MVRVAPSALRDVAVEVLVASGADATEARQVSDVMVWADRRGQFPQGTVWLDVLSERVARGDTTSPAQMSITERFPAFASIDAHHGFGQVAGHEAVRFVVERVVAHGVAVATVHNSSHFGPCGYWAARLSAHGMIGVAATNAYPKVAPFGAARAVLGTNPIGFSAPGGDAPPVIGDLSTGALAGSRVRDSRAKGEALEPGLVLDRAGVPTTDPAALDDGGIMLPFGGPKGSALALLVEILTSVLAGGTPPDEMGSMFRPALAGTSHFFLGLAPPADAPARLDHLRSMIMTSPSIDGADIRLPGDRGHRHSASAVVELPPETVDSLRTAAARSGVAVSFLR